MKTLFLLLLLSLSLKLCGQIDTILPFYKGGNENLFNYINTMVAKEYPDFAVESGIYGDVVLSFCIDSSGQISNLEVVQGIGGGCDEEAQRIVFLSKGQWVPGRINNLPSQICGYLIIRFSLKDIKKPFYETGEQYKNGFQLKPPTLIERGKSKKKKFIYR